MSKRVLNDIHIDSDGNIPDEGFKPGVLVTLPRLAPSDPSIAINLVKSRGTMAAQTVATPYGPVVVPGGLPGLPPGGYSMGASVKSRPDWTKYYSLTRSPGGDALHPLPGTILNTNCTAYMQELVKYVPAWTPTPEVMTFLDREFEVAVEDLHIMAESGTTPPHLTWTGPPNSRGQIGAQLRISTIKNDPHLAAWPPNRHPLPPIASLAPSAPGPTAVFQLPNGPIPIVPPGALNYQAMSGQPRTATTTWADYIQLAGTTAQGFWNITGTATSTVYFDAMVYFRQLLESLPKHASQAEAETLLEVEFAYAIFTSKLIDPCYDPQGVNHVLKWLPLGSTGYYEAQQRIAVRSAAASGITNASFQIQIPMPAANFELPFELPDAPAVETAPEPEPVTHTKTLEDQLAKLQLFDDLVMKPTKSCYICARREAVVNAGDVCGRCRAQHFCSEES